jgi:hypothetical protein
VSRQRALSIIAGALGALGMAGALAPGAARAAQCGRADLLDTVPPSKAAPIPPNASLVAHYDPSAEYLGEDVVLTPRGGTDEVVKVVFDGTQGLLTFTPPTPLAPGEYTIRWPGLRGLNAAALGRGGSVTFVVGETPDVAAPSFEGLTSVRWDLERQNNDCTDSLENRLVFDLPLGPADDDGGRDGLTLVVFQTAGGAVDGGSLPVLARALPAPGAHAQVKLPVADATGHVCFAALVRDLTGKTSNSGSQEICVETTAPPFFRGCAVGPGSPRDMGAVLAIAALALILASRTRRRSMNRR